MVRTVLKKGTRRYFTVFIFLQDIELGILKIPNPPHKQTAYYPEFSFAAIVHMIYVIEGIGALVNVKAKKQPLKAGDFALVNPDEKYHYRNKGISP